MTIKNFARSFSTLVARRNKVSAPVEYRRTNTARRVVTVAYKPGPRPVLAGATPNILPDIGPRRHAGILALAKSVTRRAYHRVERLTVASSAAVAARG
jgi:hypothetical protein